MRATRMTARLVNVLRPQAYDQRIVTFLMLFYLGISLAGVAHAGLNAWTSNGPEGGVIWSLAHDAKNGILYAGTGGGIFKSTDGGENWELTGKASPHYGIDVYSIALNPKNPSIIYAATERAVMKSSDGGNSWATMQPEGRVESIFAVVVDPVSPSTVYVGCEDYGIWKSTDGGKHWLRKSVGLPEYITVYALAIDPAAPSVLYAGVDDRGIYKSTDGGESWQCKTPQATWWDVYSFAIKPGSEVIYAGGNTTVSKSEDGGETWGPTGYVYGSEKIPNAEALAIDPASPDTVFVASKGWGVYKSTNDGGYWWNKSSGLVNNLNAEFYSVLVPSPNTVYLGSGDGLYKSTNGGDTWVRIGKGLISSVVKSVAIGHDGILYAGTHAGGVFTSDDSGSTWTAVNNGITRVFDTVMSSSAVEISGLAVNPVVSTKVYAGDSTGIYVSSDGGGSWENMKPRISPFVMVADPHDQQVVYAGAYASGVLKSTDGGETWAVKSTGMPDYTHVYSLALDPTGSFVLYAGTKSGIYKSSNAGESWTLIGFDSLKVSAVAVDPNRSSRVYAAIGEGFFSSFWSSKDSGSNWTRYEYELPNVWAIAIEPIRSAVYLGTENGVFKSADGVAPYWKRPNGMGNRRVKALAINPLRPNQIYAGIHGGGVADYIAEGLVKYPGKGEVVYPLKTKLSLEWDPPPRAAKCALEYSINGGASWAAIAKDLTKTIYRWTIPPIDGNQKNCFIRVKGFNNAGKQVFIDESDTPFKIEVVTLLAPKSGISIKSGTKYFIEWDLYRTKTPVANVRLKYSVDNGKIWKLIKTIPGSPEAFTWTVPQVSSTNCRVKVTLLGAEAQNLGTARSGRFTIKP